jgi:hypothetical protein
LRALREDSYLDVREMAMECLFRIAKHSANEAVWQRVCGFAAERYDAEERMLSSYGLSLIAAIFANPFGLDALARHSPASALFAGTAAFHADRVEAERRAVEEDRRAAERAAELAAEIEALSKKMCGVLELFYGPNLGTNEDTPVSYKLLRADVGPTVDLVFRNSSDRPVELRVYDVQACGDDDSLKRQMGSSDEPRALARTAPFVQRLPGERVRCRFATFRFPETSEMPPGDLRLVKVADDVPARWSFAGRGRLHLVARYEPAAKPFELWTFELGPEALTVRVDPILDRGEVDSFGYEARRLGRVLRRVGDGRIKFSEFSLLPSAYAPSLPPSVPREVMLTFETDPLDLDFCPDYDDPSVRLERRMRKQTLSGAICSAATGYRCPLAAHAHFTEEQELQKWDEFHSTREFLSITDMKRNVRNEQYDEQRNIEAYEAYVLCTVGRRCGCTSAAGGLDLRGLYHHLRHKARFKAKPHTNYKYNLHSVIFGALAERVAAAPDGSQLEEDLWNDFPQLMSAAANAATTGP